MDIRKRVGLRIRELRKSLNLTQEALAFKAEIDKTYINEIENGKRNVAIINLERIIAALESPLSEFFNHEFFTKKGVEV